MRVLYVISDLIYSGAAKQLLLLASGLPAERFQRRVCVLGEAGPWVERLQAAGVLVDVLNWRWKLDLAAFGRLWDIVHAYHADVIHVWGRSALRAVGFAGGLRGRRLMVTARLPSRKPSARLAWWDRWLLRNAECVTAFGHTEKEKWREAGLDGGRLATIPPGVESVQSSAGGLLPPRTIVCVGPLKRHKGFRDAIWVLDILRHLHPNLQLAFVGSGPDQPAIARFAHDARVADRVRFLGDCADVSGFLTQCELLWAPSRAEGGVNAVLEAMAAGKPVVAARQPSLVEIIVDGQTGFLVPPADQAALAQQTRVLLDNADLRLRMGEAGRRRVQENFPVSTMIGRFAELYEGRTASS
jgi:glycosyltransferase involved in cell wall biosynthesis